MTSTISEAQVEAAANALAVSFCNHWKDWLGRGITFDFVNGGKAWTAEARAALTAAAQAGKDDSMTILEDVVADQKQRRADDRWVDKALRESWANEFNHLVDTPFFHETVRALLAAAPPVQSGEGQIPLSELLDQQHAVGFRDGFKESLARIATLTQALTEAREVVEPFAKAAAYYDEVAEYGKPLWADDEKILETEKSGVTVGDLRRARAWLERNRLDEPIRQ